MPGHSLACSILEYGRNMKGHCQIFLLFLLWPTIFAIRWQPHSPYVNTPLGGIKGFYKTSENGRQYAAFESVPYAQPPVGELRFEPPVPVKPWYKDIEALSLPPPCPQFDDFRHKVMVEEDCLFLNVYVPKTKSLKSLPVIFWVYGGGFQMGTGNYYGAKYLMEKDVILVTMNHRVGPLGFLSTQDDVVPGNMGLKDQVVALKWIANNIRYFGGNPKKVTLMGVSAGGASVHYHYLSPQSRGLFRNGVSFSGSALNPWAFDHRNALDVAKSFATILNCPVDDSSRMLKCFKGKPIAELMEATRQIAGKWYFSSFPFVPVAEKTTKNYFINDTPENILKKGKIYDAPWIVGAVREEGLFMTGAFILNKTWIEYTDKNWETVGPLLLFANNVLPPNEQISVANKARKHYFGDESITEDKASMRKLTYLLGDANIAIGNMRAAKLQAKANKSPVRFYHYTYRANQSMTDARTNTHIDFGVSHDDDIYLVLENSIIDPTATAEDKAMLHDMVKNWYSIANEGTPNLGVNWEPVNPTSDFHYMNIAGPKNFKMISDNDFGQVQFWDRAGY